MGKLLQVSILFIVCSLMISGSINQLFAQTSNEGILSIQPNTVVSSLFNFDNKSNATLINDGDLYLFANLNNDGTVTFTEGGEGLTRFVSSNSIQQIMGTNLSRLNNVLFDNPSDQNAFHLFGNISVSGVSRFIRGIVVSDGFGGLMLFERDGSHAQTSDISHVDGYVGRRGDQVFSFPIGDAGFFRFAGISAPGSNSSVYRAKYFFEDPDRLYPRDQKPVRMELINDAEYWELHRDEGSEEVNLTLSWRDVTTPAFILGDVNRLVIAHWNQSNEEWENLGGDVSLNAQTVTTPVVLANYGVFTLAVMSSNMTNLAVEKTSFGVSIWEGDVFEYEIRVQNNSEVDATEVVIVDNLPLGVSFQGYEVETAFGLMEYSMNNIGQTLTWSVPLFMAGDEMIIKLRVKADRAGTIINYAEVVSREEDEDPIDNEDTDENRIREFFIPNVITPNGDRTNQTFEIKGLGRFASNELVIFNRYGDHVFESKDYQNNWSAEGLPAGTYFYVMTVVEDNGQEKKFQGWIQVIKE
ncbi:gliding motility-associated C-terminal domain-containing protein [Belliella kenyensis]|uniref:Gliding motility-associated C-terminal domain-containing protein n=1 Tax=Belliella kenyensis TaxID=1472724 RepID=A0ABV8EPE3_9BACT|nr:gliding motility-associated C-terminal domain-containing protein [Belliella kenyensis]MCH7402788.1 gliding motility-associated C-terminal domain-containing protein [Belliella kenyensis]MDN3602493.1 gliding motility-associated C-terminal domain-containing protein [Belliella kenyensis]